MQAVQLACDLQYTYEVFRVCNGAYNRLEDYNLDVEEISINDLTIKLLGQLNMYAPLMMEAVLPDV